MFDVGFSEIIVIALVGCLVIDPKKLPHIVKEIRIYYKKFIKVRHEVLDLVKNVDIDDLCEDNISSLTKHKGSLVKHIVGDDGNVYEAYDIKDIVKNGCEVSDEKNEIQKKDDL